MSVPTAWKDGLSDGRYMANVEDELLANVLYPEDFGGTGNNVLVDNAAAIESACDAARGHGTVVSLKRNPPYWFSSIRVSANMTLAGPNMNTVSLARIPGSTGTAVREKTLAEGNTAGATGLWIRDVCLRGYLASDPGAGGTGDQGDYGFNIGNQVPGSQLNFNSGLENVQVKNFGVGTGMLINQNAAMCSYLWSNSNATGLEFHGGGGLYHALWAEANTTRAVVIAGTADKYFGIHTEESSANEAILVQGTANTIFGNSHSIGKNKTAGVVTIDLASGASSTSIYSMRVAPNGFTYPHAIYMPAYATGTGPTQQIIPFWVDANSTNYGWYFDTFTGNSYRVNGSGIKAPHFNIFGDLTLEVSDTAGRGSAIIAGVGAQRFDSQLNIPIWSDGAIWLKADGTAA